MDSFEYITHQVDQRNNKATVTTADYVRFRKEFILEALRGKRFGQSFCERFKIQDPILARLSDGVAKYHIENLGYITR